METINVRSITPLRNFIVTPDSEEFSHWGKFKDVDYHFTIKKFNQEYQEELSEYANGQFRETLNFNFNERFWKDIDYVLTVDLSLSVPIKPLTSTEIEKVYYVDITWQILTGIRLHSTNGLEWIETIHLSDTTLSPPQHLWHRITWLMASPRQMPHLGWLPSQFDILQFESCRNTIDAIFSKNWEDRKTYHKVLNISLAYYETVLGQRYIEQSFLTLMIIFEALFKKDDTENIHKAAGTIAYLISNTKSENAPISNRFKSDENCFRELRNKIAHGEPDIAPNLLSRRFRELYGYINKALIILLLIPETSVNNYYDDLRTFAAERFNKLPVK